MTSQDLKARFEIAREAARLAGRLLLDNLESGFRVGKKGRINLVTEMDLRAEKLILEKIGEAFPEDEILSEEIGKQLGDAARRWVVDPLDGTTNYAHGYRFFCVSIAFELEGVCQFGVVYDPVTDELFSAQKGDGARLNDGPIRVSTEGTLVDSLLSTGFPYDLDIIRTSLEWFNRVLLASRAVRRDGSAALDLCYVAVGRFEGFWERGLNAWDVAAGKLMVEEAGGRVTNFQNLACSAYDGEILATNGRIHEELQRILATVPGAPQP